MADTVLPPPPSSASSAASPSRRSQLVAALAKPTTRLSPPAVGSPPASRSSSIVTENLQSTLFTQNCNPQMVLAKDLSELFRQGTVAYRFSCCIINLLYWGQIYRPRQKWAINSFSDNPLNIEAKIDIYSSCLYYFSRLKWSRVPLAIFITRHFFCREIYPVY